MAGEVPKLGMQMLYGLQSSYDTGVFVATESGTDRNIIDERFRAVFSVSDV